MCRWDKITNLLFEILQNLKFGAELVIYIDTLNLKALLLKPNWYRIIFSLLKIFIKKEQPPKATLRGDKSQKFTVRCIQISQVQHDFKQ